MAVAVDVAVDVAVLVAVGVAVAVAVGVAVLVAVADEVAVGDAVAVAVVVLVDVDVCVAVADAVAVAVSVDVAVVLGDAVAVAVGLVVAVSVGDAVAVAVLVGVAVGEAASPTPLSFTFCGLFAPPSMNFSIPCLNFPLAGGVNMTDTGQLPDAGIVLVHPLVPRLKPVPETLTTGAARSAVPLLVRVTVRGLLDTPAGIEPKLIFLEDSPTGGFLTVVGRVACANTDPLKTQKNAKAASAAKVRDRRESARPEKSTIVKEVSEAIGERLCMVPS